MAINPKDGAAPPAAENAIAVTCPCGKTATVKAEHAGKKVKCPKCERVLVVPTPPPAESLSTSDPQQLTIDEAPKPDKDLWSFLAPPQAADEIGRLGPYRVIKVLGHGGMGVVFKAEDPALKRFVALKAMLPSAAQNSSAKDRFLREARTAAALKHDHIVSIFQVGEDRGVPYLAMEFLEGESLEDCLKREGRLPVADILRIGIEIADGLAAAHEQGLIHRDIKPGNIWMEKRTSRRKDTTSMSESAPGSAMRAKILDFGLARPDDDTHLTRTGLIVGTPAYMPPEQARGLKVDGRCDLYSLGVVLYKMVTGDVPYKGKDTMSILASLALDTPVEPRMLNRGIPTRLNDLIIKLLSKDADDRPANALDVMASLEEIATDPSGQLPTPDFEAMVSRTVPKAETKALKSAAAKVTAKAAAKGTAEATAKVTAKPREAKPPSRNLWLLIALGGGGLFLLAVLLGIVILWPTPHGTVRIETDDPNVEIVFDKTGPTIKGAAKSPITLHPGPHGLVVKRGEFEFMADRFEIKDGQSITLKVELLKDKIQLVRDSDGKALLAKKLPPQEPIGKADPANKGANKEKSPETEGWVQLFNGKDLTGWRTHPEQPGDWRVENGTIEGRGPKQSHLFTERTDLRDFHLRLEAKLTEKGQSSVYVRTQLSLPFRAGDKRFPSGFSVSLGGNGTSILAGELHELGRKTGPKQLLTRVAIPPETWFKMEIIAQGDRYLAKINGQVTADYRDPEQQFSTGRLALQIHNADTVVQFRKLEMKELPPVKQLPPKIELPAVKAGEEMTNSIGMKLVSIPPGKFQMGSPNKEEDRGDNEVPHPVEITKGVWLGKYEVTQDEYEKVMGNNPSRFKGPKLPVEQVSWNDAKEFCKKLSTKEGKKYTLPTEAEWEYACRAGTKGPFSTGENLTTAQANYDGNFPYAGNAKGEQRGTTTEVGNFASNGYGLCEMHGNVWEWCEDWYGDYDAKGLAVDPKGASQGSDRVIRGGCWNDSAWLCRSANRLRFGPTHRGNGLGFRVALRSVK